MDGRGDVRRWPIFSTHIIPHCVLRFMTWNLVFLGLAGNAPKATGLEWSLETVDTDGDVGIFCSIAVDSSGFPHISYCDGTNEHLKYADKDSTGWHTAVVDTTSYVVGWYTSIALDAAGSPHISYFGSFDLRYAYMDSEGWYIETVQTGAYLGGSTSLALDQTGFPHIAYYWSTSDWGGDLRYAYKDSGGWHLELVDGGGNRGKWASLKLDGADRAHVGYCDYCLNSWYDHPEDLRYAYRGEEGWSIEIADAAGCVGAYSSLDLDGEGFPHIGYQEQVYFYSEFPKRLKYAFKDADGWHTQVVDDAFGAGRFASLAVNAYGAPRIAYWETDIRGLTFASMLGTIWHLEKVNAPGLGGGSYPSLALDAFGFPQISYHASNSSLKYVHGQGISLASRAMGNDLVLYWSPYPWATSYCCHGEEGHAYYDPGSENLMALLPPDVFTLSCIGGINDPQSEWSFVVVAVDDLVAELERSNFAGEREFLWNLP
jgi:hypothetical protein